MVKIVVPSKKSTLEGVGDSENSNGDDDHGVELLRSQENQKVRKRLSPQN